MSNNKYKIFILTLCISVLFINTFNAFGRNTEERIEVIQEKYIHKLREAINNGSVVEQEKLDAFSNLIENEVLSIKYLDERSKNENIGLQPFIVKALEELTGVEIKVDEKENDIAFIEGNLIDNAYKYVTKPIYNVSTNIYYDYSKNYKKDLYKEDKVVGVSPKLSKYLNDDTTLNTKVVVTQKAGEKMASGEIDYYLALSYEVVEYDLDTIVSSLYYLEDMKQVPVRLATNNEELSSLIEVIDYVLLYGGYEIIEYYVIDQSRILKEKMFYDHLSDEEIEFLESDKVINVVIQERPQLAFHDEYGYQTGFVIDYLNQMTENIGLKFDIDIIEVEEDRNEFIMLLSNEYDLLPIVAYKDHSKKNLENVNFTPAYFTGEIKVLKKIETELIENISELTYKKVGMVYSPIIERLLEDELGNELKNVTYYNSYQELLWAMEKDEIQYIIAEPGIEEYIDKNSKINVNEALKENHYIDFYMAVSTPNSDETRIITNILAKYISLVDSNNLEKKWFNENILYEKVSKNNMKLFEVSVISTLLMTVLVGTIIFVLVSNNKHNKAMKHMIYIDKITGKYNKIAYDKYRKNKEAYTLVVLDIDQFRNINNVYGGTKADYVVCKISSLFEDLEKEYGVHVFSVAGGVIKICIENQDRKVSNQIVKEIKKRIEKVNNTKIININVKVVMAVISSYHIKRDTDINNKEYSLYILQQLKQNDEWFGIFNSNNHKKYRQDEKIESLLVESMYEKVFPFYQPFVCTKTGKVIGCETLARLKDGDKMYFPDMFLHIAISNGLMADMDEALLKRTILYRKELLEQGLIDEDFYFSVNISAPLLRRLSIDYLIELRDELELKDFSFLQMEIVEEEISQKEIKNILNIIELFNIKVAIDDFGTGHSSIDRINQFKCDVLKLDKGLLPIEFKEIDKYKFETVLSMVNPNNEYKVTCEGVETKEHVDFLKTQGVDVFQGYYFSRPIPKEAMTEYIKEVNFEKE